MMIAACCSHLQMHRTFRASVHAESQGIQCLQRWRPCCLRGQRASLGGRQSDNMTAYQGKGVHTSKHWVWSLADVHVDPLLLA